MGPDKRPRRLNSHKLGNRRRVLGHWKTADATKPSRTNFPTDSLGHSSVTTSGPQIDFENRCYPPRDSLDAVTDKHSQPPSVEIPSGFSSRLKLKDEKRNPRPRRQKAMEVEPDGDVARCRRRSSSIWRFKPGRPKRNSPTFRRFRKRAEAASNRRLCSIPWAIAVVGKSKVPTVPVPEFHPAIPNSLIEVAQRNSIRCRDGLAIKGTSKHC